MDQISTSNADKVKTNNKQQCEEVSGLKLKYNCKTKIDATKRKPKHLWGLGWWGEIRKTRRCR